MPALHIPGGPAEGGLPRVLGATPAVIGSLQALETRKYLPGTGSNIKGQLLVWEGATTDFRKFKIRKDPDCPACGRK